MVIYLLEEMENGCSSSWTKTLKYLYVEQIKPFECEQVMFEQTQPSKCCKRT